MRSTFSWLRTNLDDCIRRTYCCGMTNAIGRAESPEPRPPLLVTGRRFNEVLDARDETMVAEFDRFKVEVVERQQAMEGLLEDMQRLMVQAMGVIKVNNLLHPTADSVRIRYFEDQQGFMHEITQQTATELVAKGGVAWREVNTLERYEQQPEKVQQAEDVARQLLRGSIAA